MTKEEAYELVDKMFEITAANAIRDMKMAKLLFCTKNGKFYSHIAKDYVEKMSEYSVYCKEEKQELWTKTIEQLIYMAGLVSDHNLLFELHIFEKTAEIMEHISNEESWEDISKLTHEQGHTNMSISALGQKMLCYSPMGIEFTEKIIGSESINHLENLNNAYKEEKEKQLALRNQKND